MLTRTTFSLIVSFRCRLAILLLGLFGHITAPIKNRGFSRVANFVSKYVAPDKSDITIRLSEDTEFLTNLKDAYWSRLVSSGYEYEPELYALCKRLHSINYLFLDCGANKGYWTLLLSSKVMGSKNVIAVEPLPDTFDWLVRNTVKNTRKATLLRNAISSESGKKMKLYYRGDHAGSTLELAWNHNPNANLEIFEVESCSIDDILENVLPEGTHPVIKLDIEGHEVEALKGAEHTLNCRPLIIFEEHGLIPHAQLTDYIRERLGLATFFLEDDGSAVEVTSSTDVILRKKNPQKGYNLCACSRDSIFFPLLDSAGH